MSSPLSASAVNHVDALQPGARLGEFEVLSLLGVGGFGMVYRAFDHSLMRFVAIKEYLPSSLAGRTQGQTLWVRSSADEQSYQAGLASFVNEARLLAQYDHPSLVKVFRFWEANHTAYMVMPLYGGMTLKQARAHMRTPPPEAWLRKVLWSVLGALRVLHDAQMLHRDVSPDNIFLQDVGPPVLLDLGAARRAISDRDRQHTAVLKVNYAPIEQYTDAGSDLRQGPWSDLYSLAAVMHGCLCNDTPLPATLRAIRDRMVPFDRVARTVQEQFGVSYSAPFVHAMSQALQLRPEDRPQSIDAFSQLLELQAPTGGLEQFDFRAELGSIWVDPGSSDGRAPPAPMPQDLAATSTTRVPQPLAQVLAEQAAVGSAAAAVPSPVPAPEPLVPSTPAASGANPQPLPPAAVDVDLVLAPEPASAPLAPPVPVPVPAPAPAPVPAPPVPAPQPPASAPTARTAARGGVPPEAPASTAPAVAGGGQGAPSRKMVFALLGLLVVAAIALIFWWRAAPKQPPRTPDDQIITEMAEAATAPASAALPAASAAAAAPAAATPAAQVASAEAPAPAFVNAPAPRPAKPATRRETPVAAAAPATTAPAAEAAPAAPAAPAPAPAAPSRPARPPNPSETCASASVLTRPMCIHRECQAAGAGSYPVCVENRRRQEEEARKREMFSQ